jgi:hypothetical protein
LSKKGRRITSLPCSEWITGHSNMFWRGRSMSYNVITCKVSVETGLSHQRSSSIHDQVTCGLVWSLLCSLFPTTSVCSRYLSHTQFLSVCSPFVFLTLSVCLSVSTVSFSVSVRCVCVYLTLSVCMYSFSPSGVGFNVSCNSCQLLSSVFCLSSIMTRI